MIREAAVMLIIKDGLILSVSRRHDATKFGLPGGKLDPGETPEEAAKRETFEETGIKVNSCVEIYKRVEPPTTPDGIEFFTYCFVAIEWEGTPADSEEGIVKWFKSDDLTGSTGAFAEYNANTLEKFKEMFPKWEIK